MCPCVEVARTVLLGYQHSQLPGGMQIRPERGLLPTYPYTVYDGAFLTPLCEDLMQACRECTEWTQNL